MTVLYRFIKMFTFLYMVAIRQGGRKIDETTGISRKENEFIERE